jgi:hypothetical protein
VGGKASFPSGLGVVVGAARHGASARYDRGAMYTHENGKWERLRMPQQPDRHIESHALVFLLSYTGSEYLIYGFRKKKLMDENVNNNTLENSAQRNNTLEN